jgi:hypothetical protein
MSERTVPGWYVEAANRPACAMMTGMIALAGSPAYDPAAWENFAVAEVSAAAALAGLLVVACSINIGRILQLPHVVSRLGATLTLFGTVLVLSSLLLVPGQDHRALGIEIAVAGLVATGAVFRMRGLKNLEPQFRPFGLTAAALGIGSAALMTLSGVACATMTIGGLYWLVAGVLLAFVIGLVNAWVALVEILR